MRKYERPVTVIVCEPGPHHVRTKFEAEAAEVVAGVVRLVNPLREYDPPEDNNGTQYVWPLPGTVVVIK